MAILLALAAAIAFGTADFLGGLAAREIRSVVVVLVSQLFGLGVLVAFAIAWPSSHLQAQALVWGSLAGLSGCVGLVLQYRCLASGVMSVVAPLIAVCAAAVPVVVGVVLGERPSAAALGGVALAWIAVSLLAMKSSSMMSRVHLERSSVASALASGLAIGGFFVFLSRTGDGSGLWPMISARVTSVVFLGGVVMSRRPVALPRPTLRLVGWCGVTDVAGGVLYLYATHHGLLSLVAVIAALYPAATIALAFSFLKERLGGRQWVGIACAAMAVILIGIGH